MRPSDKQRLRIVIFLAGIAALIGVTIHAGADTVMRILGALGFSSLAAITLMHIPIIALMGVAWWCVGREAGRLPLFIGARLVRDSVAEVLPFSQIGGFLSGLRLLALAGSNMLVGASAMLADLILEFSAKLVYTLLGVAVLLWLLPGAHLIRPFTIVLTFCFAVFGALVIFRDRFKAISGRMLIRCIRKWAPLRCDSDHEFDIWHVFGRKRALQSFAIHGGCWLFGAVEAWVTLRLMGVEVTGAQALVVDSLSTAFRTLGFLVPAALGVQEAGYVLVCALFGISPAAAIAFSLARRARDLLLGLVGLSIWQMLEVQAYRLTYYKGDAASK